MFGKGPKKSRLAGGQDHVRAEPGSPNNAKLHDGRTFWPDSSLRSSRCEMVAGHHGLTLSVPAFSLRSKLPVGFARIEGRVGRAL